MYLLTLFAQLIGSMAFNGLFDIPALSMILLLMTVYAFRKSYVRGYGLYVIFLVFYIHFAAFFNLVFSVLTEIDFVKTYMITNQNEKYVKLAKILFGFNFKSKLEE